MAPTRKEGGSYSRAQQNSSGLKRKNEQAGTKRRMKKQKVNVMSLEGGANFGISEGG